MEERIEREKVKKAHEMSWDNDSLISNGKKKKKKVKAIESCPPVESCLASPQATANPKNLSNRFNRKDDIWHGQEITES